MSWALDASAVVCWLKGEPGGHRVREVLASGDHVWIHGVNLVEVQYYFERRGPAALAGALTNIQASSIQVSRVMDDALLATAPGVKAHHAPIALGDAFAVALAAHEGATLLTTDHGEIGKLVGAGICSIELIR
jgi:uncharacterized protein with PIN domain